LFHRLLLLLLHSRFMAFLSKQSSGMNALVPLFRSLHSSRCSDHEVFYFSFRRVFVLSAYKKAKKEMKKESAALRFNFKICVIMQREWLVLHNHYWIKGSSLF
jgi:hypothetical protein